MTPGAVDSVARQRADAWWRLERTGEGCEVGEVRRHDRCTQSVSGQGNVSIDNVAAVSRCEKGAHLMRFGGREVGDVAAGQEPAELDLGVRSAGLRDGRGGGGREVACFETSSVVCPHGPGVAIGGHQDACVVYDGHTAPAAGPVSPEIR